MKLDEIIGRDYHDETVKKYTKITKGAAFQHIIDCGDYSEALAALKAGNRPLYKGMVDVKADSFISDIEKLKRISRNVNNSFTELQSSKLKSWKKFPPRDRSAICTTDKGYASSYGTVYLVLPKNRTKIGVCPDNDLHGWKPTAGKSFTASFKRVAKDVFNLEEPYTLSLKYWWESVPRLTSSINIIEAYKNDNDGDFMEQFLSYKDESGKTILEIIDHAFAPDGFDISGIKDLPENRECWFSAPAAFIKDFYKLELLALL